MPFFLANLATSIGKAQWEPVDFLVPVIVDIGITYVHRTHILLLA